MLFAATDPSVIAAVFAAVGAIVAGIFSLRSTQGAALVDDVMSDRQYLKDEVIALRAEVETLKANSRECEEALLQCRQSELRLKARVRELEMAA